jgi:hypothetical protein
VAARDELERTAPMKLDHRICPAGEAIVDLGGDLDILSADVAVNYVTECYRSAPRPVTVNLTALAFCDARGLAALVRMAVTRTGRLPIPAGLTQRVTSQDHADHRPGP